MQALEKIAPAPDYEASRQIISISQYRGTSTRNKESGRNNPCERLLLKYDRLAPDAQISMYGFVKGYIKMMLDSGADRRNLLVTLLKMGNNNIWEDIECYADELLKQI